MLESRNRSKSGVKLEEFVVERSLWLDTLCKTRENSNFLKIGKMVILVKIQNFSRSRMMKQTSPLELSRQIWLPCPISLNFETVGICMYFEAIG